MSTETAASLLLVTGFLIVLGVLIKYFGMVSLIAGYDPDIVTDKEGLAAFIGTNTLYVAVLTGFVAIFEYTQPFDGYRLIWGVFLVGVILLAVRMIRGARRYETST